MPTDTVVVDDVNTVNADSGLLISATMPADRVSVTRQLVAPLGGEPVAMGLVDRPASRSDQALLDVANWKVTELTEPAPVGVPE